MALRILPRYLGRTNFYGFTLGVDKSLTIGPNIVKGERLSGHRFYQLLVDDEYIGIKFLKKDKDEEEVRKITIVGDIAPRYTISCTVAFAYHGIFKIAKTIKLPFEKSEEEDNLYLINVPEFKLKYLQLLEICEEKRLRSF